MYTLTDGNGKKTVLEWVYSHLSPEFKECNYWLVVWSEDSYTIYGLGFNPFDIEAEIDRETRGNLWQWPTNELFHNVTAALCKHEYEHWQIVQPCK